MAPMAVGSFLICDNVLKQKYFVITDVEASKKRMGINIAFHDDSPYRKVSPGLKLFSTPSEFYSPKGKLSNTTFIRV